MLLTALFNIQDTTFISKPPQYFMYTSYCFYSTAPAQISFQIKAIHPQTSFKWVHIKNSTEKQHFGIYPTFPTLPLPAGWCEMLGLFWAGVWHSVVFSAVDLQWFPPAGAPAPVFPAFNPNKQILSLKAAPGQGCSGEKSSSDSSSQIHKDQ